MLNNLDVRVAKTTEKFDSTVLFLCKECKAFLNPKFLPEAGQAVVMAYLAKEKDFYKTGKIIKLTYMKGKELEQVLVAGCGEGKQCTANNFRKVAGSVARALREYNCQNVLVHAPILLKAEMGRYLEAVVQGLYLGAYDYDEYKTGVSKKKTINVKITTKVKNAAAVLKKATVVAEAVSFSRNLVNKPGNEVYPEVMAKYAAQVAKANHLKLEVLDEKKLKAKKMNAILAVGQGSVHKPRMIVLKYNGAGKAPYTAYVGKGITFDSGGISIKPTEGMGEMKDDMSGAADVLGAMKAIATLKLKMNLMVVLACAENMPGGNAQRPGDIVKAASGKTIEVITTDAEGRMVLADAVWYACQLGAKKVVDIATLTGAVMIALGKETAGIVANDDALAADVIKAGKFTGESYWQLPAYPEYFDLIKSPVADLKNSGGRYGGCITGGLFIGEFIEKGVAWAHLDIGGTSSAEKTTGFKPFGGTAFGVMTLVKLGELE